MERISSLGVRSESCCEEKPIVSAQTYQVGEESLLQDGPPPETSSSFTALLELPANQALELLHFPESEESPAMATAEILKGRRNDKLTLTYSLNCSPAFSSKAALAERVSRLSIFAATEGSPETSSVPSNSSENSSRLKNEPTDSESNPALSPILSDPTIVNKNRTSGKRKERQIKVKVSAKKSKQAENESSKDEDNLPYVHVRARRGQATDSHSLAERARREKINARMKLLQELVPGCNKISGTALVLDEIINHVQTLQRKVEFLSMKLAAINPRMNFGLESFFVPESGFLASSNFPSTITPSMWPDAQINGITQQQQNHHQQLWPADMFQQPLWSRDSQNSSIVPESSLFGYNSANSASLLANQLKMET